MSTENETYDEAELLSPPVRILDQSPQRLTDYIDLTQDTPMDTRLQTSRTMTRLVSLNRESRRKKTSKRLQQLVPTEVIDLNDSAEDKVSSVCYGKDSITDESVKLTCPVCLEKLSSKLKPTAPRCGHIFCEECLQNVVRKSKKCPLCQARITAKTFVRLYF